jgi:hypothetical protein
MHAPRHAACAWQPNVRTTLGAHIGRLNGVTPPKTQWQRSKKGGTLTLPWTTI